MEQKPSALADGKRLESWFLGLENFVLELDGMF
jgi:hypothetical protein